MDHEFAAKAAHDTQARIHSLQQQLAAAETAHAEAAEREEDARGHLQAAHAQVAAATRAALAAEQRVEEQYAATRQLMEQSGALSQPQADKTQGKSPAAAAVPPAKQQNRKLLRML